MKYAILADIHANLEAFQAVLADIKERQADRIVLLGDVVGYCADPKECIRLAQQHIDLIVQGNHDEYSACEKPMDHFTPTAAETILWTRKQLNTAERSFLINLPLQRHTEHFLMTHASPWHPEHWHYVINRESAAYGFSAFNDRVCFVGHSHSPVMFSEKGEIIQANRYQQFHIKPGERYIINPGSVGQPRDKDPHASYITYDTESGFIQLHRVDYDIRTAQQKILNAGLPERNAYRLSSGR